MKLIRNIFIIGIILTILFWSAITIFIKKTIDTVNADERPLFEQVGSELKGVSENLKQYNKDFQKGLSDTLYADTLN